MKTPLQVFTFSIQNKGNRTVDIFIDGQIVDASTQSILKAWFGDETSVSYKSFRDALAKEDADIFNVYINSPGGVVTDAMAIHDLLVQMQTEGKTVNTIGRGLIASSATLILLAGNEPEMTENSTFMIHNVSGGAYGTVDQIESYAVAMRKFNNMIVDLYANRTGLKKEEINNMMNAETWMTATDAVDKKFVAKKTAKADFKNSFEPEYWPFNNMAFLNQYNDSITKEEKIDMKKLFSDLTANIMAAIKGIKFEAPAANATPEQQHQALMNSIATAMQAPFDTFQASVETEISNAVSASVETAVSDLKETVSGLETEIENMKGDGSKPRHEKGETPIGSFKTAK